MTLLNLWPQEETVVRPVRRFVSEGVFAVLAAAVVTLATWLWLDNRVDNVHKAHQTLRNEWTQLKQQRETAVLSSAQMPRLMRQAMSGGLDWMGELPLWSQNGRVRWLSAKVERKYLLLEGVAQDGAAIEAVATQIRTRYPQPPLVMSEITGVMVNGEKWWRFSMKVEGVDLLYRWILPSVPADATQSPQMTPTVPTTPTSGVPNGGVSTGEAR